MNERAKDYAYEALAEVTATDMNGGRGELNMALKLIREQAPEVADDNFLLSEMIRARAVMYRSVMGDVLLTPTALAKHWQRVFEEAEHRKGLGATNQASTKSAECATCGGDWFVVVATRKPMMSPLLLERGVKPVVGELFEEVAPCPDCGQGIDTTRRAANGRLIECPDPVRVREMMSR